MILTFDPHGVTGHPDHIVSSLEVLNLLKSEMGQEKPVLLWRVADSQERKYFDKGHKFHINIDPTYHYSLSLGESIRKLRAIYSFKSKIKSRLFKLQVTEWYLLDHKELYYLVDFAKDKYNLLYS